MGVQKKPTGDLMNELKNTKDVDKYIEENMAYINDKPLHEYLTSVLSEKGLVKAEVIKKSNINEIYGYHIFSGFKKPSRDKLICILIGMELELEEINDVLKKVGFAMLYPKLVRDSIVIWGIEKKLSIIEINDMLFERGQKILE